MADPISATFAAIASAATAATAATASALIGLGVGTATAKAIASFVIPTLINAGLSIAASALLAPSVNAEGSPTEWRPNPNAGIPVAIGRVATAGSIIHMDEHGPDNRYLTIANLLSVGPIDAIESFRADRVAVTFSGTGATSPAEYASKMFLSTSTGVSGTALSVGTLPHGTASLAGWGAQSTLPGLAHTLWTLYQDSKFKSYPQGAPEPLHILRGVKVYDPRKDSTYPGGSGAHRLDDASTWEFSKNPGLHAIAWALGHKVTDPNTSKVFRVGIGATASGIHWPAFVELANVCDANGWEVSALPTSADDPHQVVKAILQAGGARYASLAGKISCIARTPRTSTVTVSAADTAGAFEIEVNADRLVKRNTITPRCVQEDHDWQMTPQDAVTVAQYVTDDGGELAQSLDFPYVAIAPASANKDQPEQLAAYAMLDSRESIIGTVPFRPHMAQVEPGDVFTVDEPGFLLDGVELLCLQRTIDPANNVVQLTFMSESAGKHTFALGLSNTPPTPPGLTAPDIRDIPAPAADIFTVTAGAGQQPTIALTVTNADAAQRAYVIEYRPTTDGAGSAITYADDATGWEVFGQFDISTENVVVTGLEPNTSYQIAIRYVSEFGILGTRRILATVTTGAMTASNVVAVNGTPAADLLADVEESLTGARDLIAAFDADAATALEAKAAVLAAIAEPGSGAVDLAGLLAEEKARINTNTDQANVRTERLENPSGNLVFDPQFSLGPADWRQTPGVQPFTRETAQGRALFIRQEVSAAGIAVRAIHTQRRRAIAGERIEVGVDADIANEAGSPVLELVSYDAGGTAISTQTLALSTGYVRSTGFFTLPANTAEIELAVRFTSTGAGVVEGFIRKPLWRRAEAGQVTPTDFANTQPEALGRLIEERIASAREVSRSIRLLLQNRELKALYKNIVITQTDGGSALVTRIETLESSNATLSSSIDSLATTVATGNLGQARQIDQLRVSANSANAVPNSNLILGPVDWTGSPTPPRIALEDSKRALVWNGPAEAAGQVARWRLDTSFPVRGGQKLEASAALKCSGVASMAVRIVWFDADMVEGDTVEAASAGPASFARHGSLDITAPVSARYAKFEITVTASGSGAGRALATEFILTAPLEGQTTLSAYTPQMNSARESMVIAARQASARQASFERHLVFQASGARAAISEEAQVRETAVGVQAQRITDLTTEVEEVADDLATNYITSANVGLFYLAKSDLEESVGLINLTVNTDYATTKGKANAAAVIVRQATEPNAANYKASDVWIDSDDGKQYVHNGAAWVYTVDGSLAPTSSVYTRGHIDQNFLVKSSAGGTLAGYSLVGTTEFADLNSKANAAAPADTVYTKTTIDQNFLLKSDKGGSLFGYSLVGTTEYAGLNSKANAAAVIVRQATEPNAANYKASDVWIDSDDGKQYVHNGTAWVYTVDNSLAPASTVYTRSHIDQNFTSFSNAQTAFASMGLALGADYSVNGEVYTKATADQKFRTLAQVNEQIAAYTFTLAAGTPDEQTGTIPALVNVNAAAVKTLEGAAAVYTIETAATGSNPAIISLSAGLGGSSVGITADKIYLGSVQIFTESGESVLLADNVVAKKVAADTVTVENLQGGAIGRQYLVPPIPQFGAVPAGYREYVWAQIEVPDSGSVIRVESNPRIEASFAQDFGLFVRISIWNTTDVGTPSGSQLLQWDEFARVMPGFFGTKELFIGNFRGLPTATLTVCLEIKTSENKRQNGAVPVNGVLCSPGSTLITVIPKNSIIDPANSADPDGVPFIPQSAFAT